MSYFVELTLVRLKKVPMQDNPFSGGVPREDDVDLSSISIAGKSIVSVTSVIAVNGFKLPRANTSVNTVAGEFFVSEPLEVVLSRVRVAVGELGIVRDPMQEALTK